MAAGARQLFWGDVHSTTENFQPLYSFFANDIVFGQDRQQLAKLSRQSRNALLSIVASFLPFYVVEGVRPLQGSCVSIY